jgi:hypothetical protein
MSEKRIFEVGYMEYPNTTLIYRSVKVDISNYPELEGKTDDEIIDYIKENAYQMKSMKEFYDSLGEELADQDIVREKVPHVDSEIWAEVSDDSDEDDEDEEDSDEDEE